MTSTPLSFIGLTTTLALTPTRQLIFDTPLLGRVIMYLIYNGNTVQILDLYGIYNSNSMLITNSGPSVISETQLPVTIALFCGTTITLTNIENKLYMSCSLNKTYTIKMYMLTPYTVANSSLNVLNLDNELENKININCDLFVNNNLNTTTGTINFGQSTVTQITNINTSVNINSNSGIITTVTANIEAGNKQIFTVNNTFVSNTSVILVSVCEYLGTDGVPYVTTSNKINGSFNVCLNNIGTASLNGTVSISFMCC